MTDQTKTIEGIRIEPGIPCPPPKRKGGYASKVIAEMAPGDSCLVTESQAATLRTYARKVKIKLTGRPEGEGTMRVWRVK